MVSCPGDCGFLAANLYAKSVFGEDALVNLSVEKGSDGKLSGYIRIRCAPHKHALLSMLRDKSARKAVPLCTGTMAVSCNSRGGRGHLWRVFQLSKECISPNKVSCQKSWLGATSTAGAAGSVAASTEYLCGMKLSMVHLS